MPIRGLSDQRRLSRLGKIKLGIVVQEPGKNPYPRATDYFVCPVEVREVFGDKPTSLDVMFPVENAAVIFPQMYKAYKASGLYCAGDGSVARRWSEQGTLLERECPCDLLKAGECKPIATLNIVLPAVRGLGVYQIVTSSPRSIVAINSALDTFAAAFGGLRGIPFVLKLEPEQTQRWDERRAQMVKTTVHVLRLDSPHSMNEILAWRRALGKPVEALMPAPEHEASDAQEPRPDEPANGQAEPSAHGAESDEAPWDVSRVFADLDRRCQVKPDLFERWCRALHGVGAGDLSDAVVASLATRLRTATDEAACLLLKADLVRDLNRALAKPRS